VGVLKWAHEKGIRLRSVIHLKAAKRRDKAMSEWAIANGCRPTNKDAVKAARTGRCETLEYLRMLNCPMNERVVVTLVRASTSIRIPWVISWVLLHGLPLSAAVFEATVRYGDVPLLKRLLGAGCPWDSRTIRTAKRYNYPQIVEWARQKGCPTTVVEHDTIVSGDELSSGPDE
jgi:hypothetical protein